MGIIPVIEFIINALFGIINVIVSIGNFANEHLGSVENLLIAMGIAIVATLIAWKIATISVVGAKIALKKALIATGIGALVVLIGLIVLAIMNWIDSIGGLRVAWLMVANAIMTAWDWVKIGFFTGVHFVMDLWDRMALGMRSASTAIANFMGDMRANVLMILQNMVNGAIDIINGMIRTLNRIPGVNIGVIEQVTFGTQAQLENEANRQARNAALDDYRAQIEANITSRADSRQQMMYDAWMATAARQAEIDYLRAAARYEAQEQVTTLDFLPENLFDGSEGFGNLARDVLDIAANTGTMANISGKNLKYWRDIAERDNINRHTLGNVNLIFRGGIHNTVNSEMDLDSITDYVTECIVEGLEEAIETTAERTNDYVD